MKCCNELYKGTSYLLALITHQLRGKEDIFHRRNNSYLHCSFLPFSTNKPCFPRLNRSSMQLLAASTATETSTDDDVFAISSREIPERFRGKCSLTRINIHRFKCLGVFRGVRRQREEHRIMRRVTVIMPGPCIRYTAITVHQAQRHALGKTIMREARYTRDSMFLFAPTILPTFCIHRTSLKI